MKFSSLRVLGSTTVLALASALRDKRLDYTFCFMAYSGNTTCWLYILVNECSSLNRITK